MRPLGEEFKSELPESKVGLLDSKVGVSTIKAYEALGGGEGPGKYHSKVQGTTSKSKVQNYTLKDFYEGIGKVQIKSANWHF